MSKQSSLFGKGREPTKQEMEAAVRAAFSLPDEPAHGTDIGDLWRYRPTIQANIPLHVRRPSRDTPSPRTLRGEAGSITSRGRHAAGLSRHNPERADQQPPQSGRRQCEGAPIAPGTGATPDSLMAQARLNAAEVSKHKELYPFNTALWFRSQVENRGPWDYKQYDRGFENFGNYNYGYVGAAIGIPEGILLRQAGKAQGRDGNKGDGGSPGNGFIGGSPPYGDQKIDQEMIKRGIRDRKRSC